MSLSQSIIVKGKPIKFPRVPPATGCKWICLSVQLYQEMSCCSGSNSFLQLCNSLLFLVALRELSRELRGHKFSSGNCRHDKLGIQGRGLENCALKVCWHRSTHGRKHYYPLVPCTSEIITSNSVKVCKLVLLIWKCKSSKPQKKFFISSVIFKQLIQSGMTLFFTWEISQAY